MSGLEHATQPVELSSGAIRWTRRPGYVFVLYGYRWLAAALLALPLSVEVQSKVVGLADGDEALFAPGGYYLVEVVRQMSSDLGGYLWGLLIGLRLIPLVGLLPFGALVAALSVKGKTPLRFGLSGAGRGFGGLLLLLGINTLIQGIWAALSLVGGAAIISYAMVDGPAEDQALMWLLIPFALGSAVLATVHDLARVDVVMRGEGVLRGLGRAFGVLRRSFFAALGAYVSRAIAALALFVCAIAVLDWLGGASVSTGRALLLHQMALLGIVIARVSWIAAAMRLCRAVDEEPAPAGRAKKAPATDPAQPGAREPSAESTSAHPIDGPAVVSDGAGL